jgi:hypothetical protein
MVNTPDSDLTHRRPLRAITQSHRGSHKVILTRPCVRPLPSPAHATRQQYDLPVPDDDVEARVTGLEQEVTRLREQIALTSSDAAAARADSAAARVLAAGADRDVSEVRAELRAHTQALNALRETRLEHSREMHEGFAAQSREMRDGFATLAVGMAHITALLTETNGSSTTDDLHR